jgi:hypothetical protein
VAFTQKCKQKNFKLFQKKKRELEEETETSRRKNKKEDPFKSGKQAVPGSEIERKPGNREKEEIPAPCSESKILNLCQI